jgi:hypothetical protein
MIARDRVIGKALLVSGLRQFEMRNRTKPFQRRAAHNQASAERQPPGSPSHIGLHVMGWSSDKVLVLSPVP